MAVPLVPYFRQQGEDHCGAACLQMVMGALGLAVRSQAQLFNDARAHGALDAASPWNSPPDGLEWALENRAGMTAGSASVASFETEPPLTRRIIWSLFQHGVPPIVLVYGWAHWLVVVNYDTSRDPNSASDAGYTINALDIHDPWRDVLEGNPPPPPPPRHVTFRQWQRTYLKPVPSGHWQGAVVAVGVFS